MAVQLQNSNLNYLIDPKFTNVNRLIVLPFRRIAGGNNTTKIKEIIFHIIMCQMPE